MLETDPVVLLQLAMAGTGMRLVARFMTVADGAATRLRLLSVLNIFTP